MPGCYYHAAGTEKEKEQHASAGAASNSQTSAAQASAIRAALKSAVQTLVMEMAHLHERFFRYVLNLL